MKNLQQKPARYYAKETWKRIQEVRELVTFYQDSMKHLKAFAEGKANLFDKGYRDAAENYRRTPEDEQRCIRTCQHLKQLIQLYEHELTTLYTYGRLAAE